MFSLKGRDGARMQAIADEAEINKAMLHYYFRSKNKLYEATFDHIVHKFFERTAARLAAAASFDDALRAFIDSYVELGRKRPEVVRLLLIEHLSGGGTLAPRLRRLYDRPDTQTGHLLHRVEAAMRSGELRQGDPIQVVLTIVSCCMCFFVVLPTATVFSPEIAEDLDGFIDARKAHLFETLRRGLT